MNILLIEPDRVLSEAYKTAFRASGHKVVVKRSGQTALDALDQQLPDVIVLELQLGTHNGIEYLYELRSYGEWQNVPVVVHTINARAEDEVYQTALKQLGVEAVLYKPHTKLPQLISAVERVVVKTV